MVASTAPPGGAPPAIHNGATTTAEGTTPQAKFINTMLCRSAERGNVQGILNIVAENFREMNCVNLSTALHKLARLAKEDGGASAALIASGDWRLAALHHAAREELERQKAANTRSATLPRCWATIAWSYGTLQIVDNVDVSQALEAISELAIPSIADFKALELTNLLWAFAKTQVSDARLFQAARKHILGHLSSFSPSHISTLVWVFVTANQYQASMLHVLAQEFADRLRTSKVNPVELANLMWGLATAKVHPKAQVLNDVGCRAQMLLPEFKLQELSITTWAFSRLGARHDRLFAGAAAHLCASPVLMQQIHSQGIANLLWAFEKQKAMGSIAAEHIVLALRALIPKCLQLLDQLKPQEFTCVCRALAKLGFHFGTCQEADQLFISAAHVGVDILKSLSVTQCVDLLEAFASFLNGNNSQGRVPVEVFEHFVEALLCTSLSKVGELEALSACHSVAVMAVLTEHLRASRGHFVNALAHVALKLTPERFSTVGQQQLAVLCGLPPYELDVATLRAALTAIVMKQQAAHSMPPEVAAGTWDVEQMGVQVPMGDSTTRPSPCRADPTTCPRAENNEEEPGGGATAQRYLGAPQAAGQPARSPVQQPPAHMVFSSPPPPARPAPVRVDEYSLNLKQAIPQGLQASAKATAYSVKNTFVEPIDPGSRFGLPNMASFISEPPGLHPDLHGDEGTSSHDTGIEGVEDEEGQGSPSVEESPESSRGGPAYVVGELQPDVSSPMSRPSTTPEVSAVRQLDASIYATDDLWEDEPLLFGADAGRQQQARFELPTEGSGGGSWRGPTAEKGPTPEPLGTIREVDQVTWSSTEEAAVPSKDLPMYIVKNTFIEAADEDTECSRVGAVAAMFRSEPHLPRRAQKLDRHTVTEEEDVVEKPPASKPAPDQAAAQESLGSAEARRLVLQACRRKKTARPPKPVEPTLDPPQEADELEAQHEALGSPATVEEVSSSNSAFMPLQVTPASRVPFGSSVVMQRSSADDRTDELRKRGEWFKSCSPNFGPSRSTTADPLHIRFKAGGGGSDAGVVRLSSEIFWSV